MDLVGHVLQSVVLFVQGEAIINFTQCEHYGE